ncbi:MAG TPA: AAA family ATPase [Acidimicrobiales bacterium]
MEGSPDARPPAPSVAHLLGRLSVVEARVRIGVSRRRSDDPDPDDRFRGLYTPDSEVDRLLAGTRLPLLPDDNPEGLDRLVAAVETAADEAEVRGADLRLRRLERSFDLTPLDTELLLVAMAPDLDPRFERLYGYLNDDVSRRRASIGLALELCGALSPARGGRSRLGPTGPLVESGLVLVEDPDRPFLGRALRVPDRVTAHLLGDDAPDPLILGVTMAEVDAAIGDTSTLERSMASGQRLVYVRQPNGGAGFSLAAAAARRAGVGALLADLSRLDGDGEAVFARRLAREARLRGCVVVAGPVEAFADRGPAAVRALADTPVRTLVLLGSRTWDPTWSRDVPLVLDAPVPTPVERGRILSRAFEDNGDADDDGNDGSGRRTEGIERAAQFRLAPEHLDRAARSASIRARAHGRTVTEADLLSGVRGQNAAGLERLARRVEPAVAWADLVLPGQVLTQLQELVARVRQRERVLDEWGLAHGGSRGRGVKALFAGESGTGKTMSAEVLAGELGLDLYVIDLSTVVDKYVGETEKNLDRIFAEAERVNGVLLFDEADALFGKRSDVRDAQDRYANVETAYLLQRMESFEGLAVLTTNLRSNIDDAFARRLDVIVDFPMPEDRDRLRLWELHLGPSVPRAGDIDFAFLAKSFRIAGGNIRNVALGAAFIAADADRAVSMLDLVRATEREYRKLGRLCVESEFGPYLHQLVGPR